MTDLQRQQPPVFQLWAAHLFFIVLSNYAVQIPVTVLGIDTTWGTFTYPFLFVLTDLTVRLFGQDSARRLVFMAMMPALVLSYVVGTIFEQGDWRGWMALGDFSLFIFRIAFASFCGYVTGQILDITVFQRLRELKSWWVAPTAASIVGNLIDTAIFYSVAFYRTTDPYLAEHWVELGTVDYCVKILFGLSIFVPMYGVLLSVITKRFLQR